MEQIGKKNLSISNKVPNEHSRRRIAAARQTKR
jgi:hypothetical protein